MTYGMLIDLKKCVGCHACAVACKEAHGTRPGVTPLPRGAHLRGHLPERPQDVGAHAVHALRERPRAWRCARRTPRYKRDDGIVVIEKDKCIGCGSCHDRVPLRRSPLWPRARTATSVRS